MVYKGKTIDDDLKYFMIGNTIYKNDYLGVKEIGKSNDGIITKEDFRTPMKASYFDVDGWLVTENFITDKKYYAFNKSIYKESGTDGVLTLTDDNVPVEFFNNVPVLKVKGYQFIYKNKKVEAAVKDLLYPKLSQMFTLEDISKLLSEGPIMENSEVILYGDNKCLIKKTNDLLVVDPSVPYILNDKYASRGFMYKSYSNPKIIICESFNVYITDNVYMYLNGNIYDLTNGRQCGVMTHENFLIALSETLVPLQNKVEMEYGYIASHSDDYCIIYLNDTKEYVVIDGDSIDRRLVHCLPNANFDTWEDDSTSYQINDYIDIIKDKNKAICVAVFSKDESVQIIKPGEKPYELDKDEYIEILDNLEI